MTKAPDQFEQEAFDIVEHVTGLEVRHWDTGEQSRQVDAHLLDGEATIGALEVSSLGTEDEAALDSHLRKIGSKVEIPGITWLWYVSIPDGTSVKRLAEQLEHALPLCEQRDCTELGDLYGEEDDAIDQLLDAGVGAWGQPNVASPCVYLQQQGVGGLTEENLDDLPRNLSDILFEPPMLSNASKLRVTGLRQLHLFLFVRPTGLPFASFDGLVFSSTVPNEPPMLPQGITHLWLMSGRARRTLVRWAPDIGWERPFPGASTR